MMASLQNLPKGSSRTRTAASSTAPVHKQCFTRRLQSLPGTRPSASLAGGSSLQTQQRDMKQIRDLLCRFSHEARREFACRCVATQAAEEAASTATVTLTAAPLASEGLLELNKDTFYSYLEQHADTLVVVDFYTDWCGPCKVIYPQLVKLAEERTDIRIVKFNCNKANKELGVKLGIKVAPTFHLYRNSIKVGEMTGAKLESLVALIDKAQTADAAESA